MILITMILIKLMILMVMILIMPMILMVRMLILLIEFYNVDNASDINGVDTNVRRNSCTCTHSCAPKLTGRQACTKKEKHQHGRIDRYTLKYVNHIQNLHKNQKI